jgi:putative acetyltransferase
VRISLRRYKSDDAEGTWRAFDESVSRTAALYYTPAQIAAWNPGTVDLKQWNGRRARAWTIVADAEAKIAGFSDLTADGELDMLFVHPDFGGRGVARALVSAVLDEARRRGLPEVRTHASRAARPALERLGFVTDRENVDNRVRGHLVPNYDMHVTIRLTS